MSNKSPFTVNTFLNNFFCDRTLTFTQKTTPAKIGRNGRINNSTQEEVIPAKGSLNPFDKYNNKVVLPEGIREQDVHIFYSQESRIRQADQTNKLPAATTIIDGDVYEVFNKRSWTDSKSLGFIQGREEFDYVLIRQNPVEPPR